jgi:hypothetical protein
MTSFWKRGLKREVSFPFLNGDPFQLCECVHGYLASFSAEPARLHPSKWRIKD